ncbi:hypothetical protein P8452_46588 [Trifolium repens]|nr:hypothetical protein P8452_46588 [Trifolium repens]
MCSLLSNTVKIKFGTVVAGKGGPITTRKKRYSDRHSAAGEQLLIVAPLIAVANSSHRCCIFSSQIFYSWNVRQFEAVATEPEGPKESRIGFASQLHFLVYTLQMSFEAHFIKYFVSATDNPGSDNLKSSTVVPSPTIRDRVLKELFIEVTSDIWSTNLPHGQGTGVLGYQRVKRNILKEEVRDSLDKGNRKYKYEQPILDSMADLSTRKVLKWFSWKFQSLWKMLFNLGRVNPKGLHYYYNFINELISNDLEGMLDMKIQDLEIVEELRIKRADKHEIVKFGDLKIAILSENVVVQCLGSTLLW